MDIHICTATNLHFRVYENPLFEELLNQKLISMLSKIDDAKSAISFPISTNKSVTSTGSGFTELSTEFSCFCSFSVSNGSTLLIGCI